jgi:hypothetical protein
VTLPQFPKLLNQVLLVITISLSLLSCGSLNSNIQTTDFELPALVETVFQVLVPEESQNAGSIYLTVLDPLTGDLINPQHNLMEQDGDRSYRVTVNAPVGSMLQYRYTLGIEHISERGLVSSNFTYRSFYIDGPSHVVTDVIAGWNGSTVEFEPGAISGQIVSETDQTPLENIRVIVSGLETRSDPLGHFTISGLEQGLHNIIALSPSGAYLPFQQGALIASNSDTPALIELIKNQKITVNFSVTLPEDHVPGVPLFLLTNLVGLEKNTPDSYNENGQAIFVLELPSIQDIRYKYSLGDGFWNAEHLNSGEYLTRQLVLDTALDGIVISDHIASWTVGNSAPIWFEATTPPTDAPKAYIQFLFSDWTESIQMWPLGVNQYAYKLNSPTNFAAPLQYRYCQDVFCVHGEEIESIRSISGNLEVIQYSEDQIEAWK